MENKSKISAVILAAGSSLRFGKENKLDACIFGTPILHHAVQAFVKHSMIDEIIIVTKEDKVDQLSSYYKFSKNITVISGGDSRNQSSLIGVIKGAGDIVLIHDGARPFVEDDMIVRCIEGAKQYGAVAAAIPATDTIKICDSNGKVTGTTQRSNTWRTQSPQAFNRQLLLDAYNGVDPLDPTITDDCMVVESKNIPVHLVMGSDYNIKITTQADLTMAESIAKELGLGGNPRICTAIGQDSHRTSKQPTEKPMVLGGVVLEDFPALEANSDGDVVLHAITNGVSGVTGVNILGKIADEICQSGIKDSRVYLKESLKYLKGKITHISVTIECKTPHLSQHIPKMKEVIGDLVNLPPSHIGITATSGEGLTDFGRGEGVSVFCVVTAEVYS